MDLISIRGAYDIHSHSHPSLFPRLCDDRQLALAAREAGMAGIILKAHHESTVSRAYLLSGEIKGIEIYGGICLNYYVGGINPAAVEAALQLGAKNVWMPTIDALNHARVYGSRGRYDVQSGGREAGPGGVTVLKDGKISGETIEVLELIARHNAILSTCHLSPEEVRLLVKEAQRRKVGKVLITHPFEKVPNVDVDFLKEMVACGAKAEFAYCTVSPMWALATIDRKKEAIKELGASNCVIVSDVGQRHNPIGPEALRIFAQCFYEKGISLQELETMMIKNPRELLS